MRPFGRSLTYSLNHAGLRDDGYAVWEEDYCSPPLAQERAAALDEFFDDLARIMQEIQIQVRCGPIKKAVAL